MLVERIKWWWWQRWQWQWNKSDDYTNGNDDKKGNKSDDAISSEAADGGAIIMGVAVERLKSAIGKNQKHLMKEGNEDDISFNSVNSI